MAEHIPLTPDEVAEIRIRAEKAARNLVDPKMPDQIKHIAGIVHISGDVLLRILDIAERREADWKEPFMPADLEDTDIGDHTSVSWTAKALKALATMLGVGNDFYYPLIGAANLLDHLDAAPQSAFTAGAEAMREVAAKIAARHSFSDGNTICAAIRSALLPIKVEEDEG